MDNFWLKTENLFHKRKLNDNDLNLIGSKIIKLENASLSTPPPIASTSSTLWTTETYVEPSPNAEEAASFEVWNDSQQISFKNKYPWLTIGQGKLGCIKCSAVKGLGVKSLGELKTKRFSEEWSSSLIEATGKDRQSKLSNIRIKIKKHVASASHELAEKIYADTQQNRMEECAVALDDNLSLFRTAYFIARTNRSFSDYEDLISLQQMNGLKLASILHSPYSVTNIISHIACEMRERLIFQIITLNSKFSVLIDETTTLSDKLTIVIYLKAYLGEESLKHVFLDLCELESQDAESIEKTLLETLNMHGLTEEFLQKNWIAIATDGASAIVGKHSGVITRLKQRYSQLFAWHCLNHKLELSVSDSIKDLRWKNNFESFLDKLFSLYSRSPTNCRALQLACPELGLKFTKLGLILGTRWVSSSFKTVQAVWESYESLHSHTKTSCENQNPSSTYHSLEKTFESVEFVLDLGLMYDVLQELSILSLELQSRTTSLLRAEHLIKRTIRILESFKTVPGEKTVLAKKASETLKFKNICLVRNPKISPINNELFLQSMVDRMTSRLCSENEELLKDISTLDPKNIKPENVRFGETEMKRICRRFDLNEIEAIEGLRDLGDNNEIIPEKLKPYLRTILTLPCSTTECERGFFLMNNIITDLGSSLSTSNVSSLMFLNSNGPPLDRFQPEKYVRSWLTKYRSSSNDTRSGVSNKNETSRANEDLWQIF